MSNQQNLSAREYAAKYINARSAKGRKSVRDAVEAKAGASKRKRWASLLAAIDAGDQARVEAFAAQGEAKREAWAKARGTSAKAPAKPEPKAEAKAEAKPAKAPATRKRKAPAKQAEPEPEINAEALADQLAKLDDKAFAAFFNAVAKKRNA